MMSAATQYPHLTIDADGMARIEQTRYKVLHLAGEHYYYGWSAEEILRQHQTYVRAGVLGSPIFRSLRSAR